MTRLGELLMEEGLLTPEALDELLTAWRAQPDVTLESVIRASKQVDDVALTRLLSRLYGFDVIDHLPKESLDSELIAKLPVEWARTHHLLPFRHRGQAAVLTCDPSAIGPMDDLAALLGCELTPVLAPAAEIQRAIEQCYFHRTEDTSAMFKEISAEEDAPLVEAREDDLLRRADQAPVAHLVNIILLEAVKRGASDIHIEPFDKKLVVRYRIDGVLYEQPAPSKHLEAALTSRLKVMARLDIAERRLPQDGAARVRVGERELDIRVATVPVSGGERMVLRLLNREATLLPLEELGMAADILVPFRAACREPNGIIFVTGPTGSGKTTTLYAALQEVDTSHMNVLTIEDPVEYQLPRIGQIQVKPKIGLTFARGLRHILRQDPDVILVGETRDLETAEIAIRASMTGHLVFTTLHTNDAVGAVTRLVDMGVPPYLLASTLRAALAQRLVRRLCPHCREETDVSQDDLAAIGHMARILEGRRVWRAHGCEHCLGGYRGRTGIHELLLATPAFQEAVRQNAPVAELQTMAQAKGMRPMVQDGLIKALNGVTSLAELLRSAGHTA